MGFKTVSLLTFTEFVACEVSEAVVGSVFVKFAERRIVENLFNKFVDGEAVVEDHHANVDEFGGVFADDADAKKFFVSTGEDELEQSCGISGDVATRVVGVKSAAHDVVDSLFLARFFGLAGGGNLGNGVNPHGEQRSNALFVLQTKCVADGDAALFHRSGSKRGKSNDVACGINMWDNRSVVFVHGNVAAIIDSEAGLFQSEPIDSSAAASSKERGIGFEDFAALHREAYTT